MMLRKIGLLLFGTLVLTSSANALPLPLEGLELRSGKVQKVSPGTKGLVAVFLSAKCPCSQSHEAGLVALAKEFESKGFQFLGLHANADESLELGRLKFQDVAFPFPVLRDEGAKLAETLGANRTPHAFVLNPQGEVLFQGGVDDNKDAQKATRPYLRNALEAILAGKTPDPAIARSLGCVIARPAPVN